MSSMVNSNGRGSHPQNSLAANKNPEAIGQSTEASFEQQQYELRQRLLMQNNINGMSTSNPNTKAPQPPNAIFGRQQSQQRNQTGSQGPP